MKVSFISTVFNEAETITQLLRSLAKQSRFADEIIFVDGGSSDSTFFIISNFKFPNSKKKIKIIIKKGNRSIGRNEAIKNATGDIIVCTDAGNILDKNWIENIVFPFIDTNVDVVAGYYKGKAKTVFQKCLIPYVLVMPDKIDARVFLPTTRSIAFRKDIWRKVGGFPVEYSHNEDYVFAVRLKKIGARMVFTKNAIVYWLPRENIKEAFIMFFRFALGDAESGTMRIKVLFVYFRYLVGLLLVSFSFYYSSSFTFFVILLFIVYLIWSIEKNYKYVNNIRGLYILPLIQFIADISILIGTTRGIIKRYFGI